MATKVVTKQLVRFSYVTVFEPKESKNGQMKYSVSLIIPKTNVGDINAIKAAIAEATEAGKAAKFGGKIPPMLKTPLRDGDLERPEDPAYAGCYFINASSSHKPGILDANMRAITDPADFYSGCWGRVSLNFYPFNVDGNRGIAAGLNNLQKVKDDESLAGTTRAEDDFNEFAEEGAAADFLN